MSTGLPSILYAVCQYILSLIKQDQIGSQSLAIEMVNKLLNISGYCYYLESSNFYLKQRNLSHIQWYLYLILLQQEVATCIEAGREHPDFIVSSRTSLCPRGDSSTVCKNALVSVKKLSKSDCHGLNQIPYDYTVEVRNRFKGLDLIHRLPDELWTEIHDIVQETEMKTIPIEKKCKKANWLSGEALK